VSRHALLVSGGALRGPFSVPIIEHVWTQHGPPEELGGTSIGALHCAAISGGDIDSMRKLWMSVDDRRQMLSIPVDLFSGGLADGLVSMKRARKILRRNHIGLRRKIPVHVGIVDAATGEVRQVPLTGPYDRVLDCVFASASLSPAMEITHYWWEGKKRIGYDGGLFEVLPRAVGELGAGDRVTAIFHSPITAAGRRKPTSQRNVSTAWGMLGSQLDDIVDRAVLERDMPYLQSLADRGVIVDVYAPESWDDVGPSWTYDATWRDHRMAAGDRAVARGPIRLEPRS